MNPEVNDPKLVFSLSPKLYSKAGPARIPRLVVKARLPPARKLELIGTRASPPMEPPIWPE